MRAIWKTLAVGAVIAVLGLADGAEMFVLGVAMAAALPFVVWRLDRRVPREQAQEVARASVTLDVIPLPRPAAIRPIRPMEYPIDPIDDDVEGKTVRAPLSHEEAYEMHARYAPAFDREVAVNRYVEKHGDDATLPLETAVPEQDPPSFDQRSYASALEYVDAFDAQLRQRRTRAYGVAQPQRIARGSYTPQQYEQPRQRSDQPASEWDSRTLVGANPIKPSK